MKIKILTLFPEMFESVLGTSIMGRALQNELLEIELVNIRDYTLNKHNNTDDYPFGGGAGMVMMAQPVIDAVRAHSDENTRRIYMSPRGRTLTQHVVEEYAGCDSLLFLCGHYEGVDQRALDTCIDEELSIGDYVLTGGELGAMVTIDAVSRLIPGVLGHDESAEEESFSMGLLEYPQYTRPADYMGMKVPDVLLGGNHADITAWRRRQSLEITRARRPEMLESAPLTESDRMELERMKIADDVINDLKACGVHAERLDLFEEAAFPKDWISLFVLPQHRREAKRRCITSKKHIGYLYQAFESGFATDSGEEYPISGAGTLYIDGSGIAFSVDRTERVPLRPRYVLVSGDKKYTYAAGKGQTRYIGIANNTFCPIDKGE